MFICKYCGKECKSKLSKSCHERLCKLNPNKVDTTYLSQNAINTNINKIQKHNDYKLYLKKIKFECVCENCNKIFYIEDYENRKYFPKCCSSFCSHSLSGKTNSKGTKQIKCMKCGNIFEANKHSNSYICNNCKLINKEAKSKNTNKSYIQISKIEMPYLNRCIVCNNLFNIRHRITCSDECHNIYLKNRKQYLSKETLQKFREVGKESAKKQSELRRSKNEIEFCKLCENYFDNVEHNKPIFNGWDGDIILPDIKFAILWNGNVHYKPIFGEANYNRIINRDKIKLKEINNAGYIPYIIKDIGKHNNNFVQEKFDEFIKYLIDNDYI